MYSMCAIYTPKIAKLTYNLSKGFSFIRSSVSLSICELLCMFQIEQLSFLIIGLQPTFDDKVWNLLVQIPGSVDIETETSINWNSNYCTIWSFGQTLKVN